MANHFKTVKTKEICTFARERRSGGGSDSCAACRCCTYQPHVSTVTLHQATSELSPGWWGNTMYACRHVHVQTHLPVGKHMRDTQGDIREASPPHTSSHCPINFSLSKQDVPLVFKSFCFFSSDTLQMNPWWSITKMTQMCFNVF